MEGGKILAYFNGYPATYTPYYTPVAPVQVPQQQNNTNVQSGLIWVQGEAGAKSYLVAPNSTVQLWDSEAQVIYLKSADASGMPSIKVLDYTIRESSRNAANSAPKALNEDLSNYATKDEIRAVSAQIEVLRDRLDGLTRKRRKEDDDE